MGSFGSDAWLGCSWCATPETINHHTDVDGVGVQAGRARKTKRYPAPIMCSGPEKICYGPQLFWHIRLPLNVRITPLYRSDAAPLSLVAFFPEPLAVPRRSDVVPSLCRCMGMGGRRGKIHGPEPPSFPRCFFEP